MCRSNLVSVKCKNAQNYLGIRFGKAFDISCVEGGIIETCLSCFRAILSKTKIGTLLKYSNIKLGDFNAK